MTGAPLDIAGEALAALSAYHTPPDPAPIKLDANESPWPLPEDARRRLAERLAAIDLHRYPDGGARALTAALCARLGAAPDELLLGAGSDEVIGILLRALDRPRAGAAKPTVLLPSPTFVMYPITSRVEGFDPIEVPLRDDFGLDVDAMCAAIDERRPNLVFLATPNNPTGNTFDDAALERIVAHARDALVVIDEAYAPFAGRTLNDWVDRHPNVGVMGTLSKIGLAGLRVGWIRLRPELAHEANKARPPYNLSTPAQVAATFALTELSDTIDDWIGRIVAERATLAAALSALEGVTVYPSAANFLLVEVDDAEAIQRGLLEVGVQVRRFAKIPRLARHLRITVGTPDENRRLVDALGALSADARG